MRPDYFSSYVEGFKLRTF